MIEIGVLGSKGRMGQELVEELQNHPRCRLSLAGTRENKEPLYQGSDVVIDFTAPDALSFHLDLSLAHKKPMVIGTTGLDSTHRQKVSSASVDIPIVLSPNMSPGITLLANLVQKTAQLFDETYDIEIAELHHRHKKDAPSGTALMLGNAAAKGRGKNLDSLRYNPLESGRPSERPKGAIGFAVQRGGSAVGDHSIRFIGEDEMLELSHRSLSRKVYAKGALCAAEWLVNQKPGLYSMEDVLGL